MLSEYCARIESASVTRSEHHVLHLCHVRFTKTAIRNLPPLASLLAGWVSSLITPLYSSGFPLCVTHAASQPAAAPIDIASQEAISLCKARPGVEFLEVSSWLLDTAPWKIKKVLISLIFNGYGQKDEQCVSNT